MGDHQHHAPGIGQLAQHGHHLTVQRRIQPRGRFVEDQQRRSGQQFQRHRRPFALATGEPVDAGIGVRGHLQFGQHLFDHLLAVLGRGVRRKPQLGRVHQGLVDGELTVHHIVLGHHPDPGAQRGVLGVDVVALEADRAGGGVGEAGDLAGQGRLARAGRSDDRGQRSGAGGERDVLQQRLVALDRPGEPANVQSAGSGGRRRLGPPRQRGAVEDQVDVADGDHIARIEQGRVHPVAVDEGAVDGPVVGELGPARGRDQGGVMARGQHVGDDDVVVGGPPDGQRSRWGRSR